MRTYHNPLQRLMHRMSPITRTRGAVLKRFYKSMGLVYFGTVHQHDDDLDTIRGFTASLSHRDVHYAVGTYNGYSIRLVDRFDVVKLPGIGNHAQFWTIIEIELARSELSHTLFVPTGRAAQEYSKIFMTQPHMQPLNTMLTNKHSSEFHGRYQILARATHLQKFEEIFTSNIIVAMGSRFWPLGIEIEHGRLLVYITDRTLSKPVLDSIMASSLWLADVINESDTYTHT